MKPEIMNGQFVWRAYVNRSTGTWRAHMLTVVPVQTRMFRCGERENQSVHVHMHAHAHAHKHSLTICEPATAVLSLWLTLPPTSTLQSPAWTPAQADTRIQSPTTFRWSRLPRATPCLFKLSSQTNTHTQNGSLVTSHWRHGLSI